MDITLKNGAGTVTGTLKGIPDKSDPALLVRLPNGEWRGLDVPAGQAFTIEGTLTPPPPPPPIVPPSMAPPAGWPQVLRDDFTEANRGIWRPMDAKFGQPDRPLRNDPGLARIVDGALVLSGERLPTPDGAARYGVGGVWTRGAGFSIPVIHHFRAVFECDWGQGFWPAIWATITPGGGSACEFDYFEGFHVEDGRRPRSTLFADKDPGAGYSKKVSQAKGPVDLGPGLHVVDGRVSRLDGGGFLFETWFDGRLTMAYRLTDRLQWSRQGRGWDLLLNLQLGGPWVGDPDGQLGYLAGAGRVYPMAARNRLGGPVGGDTPDGRAVLPNDSFRIHSIEVWAPGG